MDAQSLQVFKARLNGVCSILVGRKESLPHGERRGGSEIWWFFEHPFQPKPFKDSMVPESLFRFHPPAKSTESIRLENTSSSLTRDRTQPCQPDHGTGCPLSLNTPRDSDSTTSLGRNSYFVLFSSTLV